MKNYFIANGEVLNTNMSIEEMELRVQATLDESTSGMAQFRIKEISEKEIRMFFVRDFDYNPNQPIIFDADMALMFYQWGLFSLSWWWIVIALIVCTGIINAYNFMDGINGITGGYSLVILAALAYINKEVITFVEADFIYTVICSVLVFCFFNFRKKAKCFAGDVGSVGIAFILLFLIGRLIIGTGDFSWIVLLSVYGVDSVLTIIHRLMLHENIGLPHRKHLYQIMANELKIPHVMVSSIYMVVQAIIVVGYIMYMDYGYWYLIGTVILLSLIYICFMKKFFRLHQF